MLPYLKTVRIKFQSIQWDIYSYLAIFVTQRLNDDLPANFPFTFQKLDTVGAKVQRSI